MPIRRIYADISELLNGVEELVLDSDASSGDSTITVKSIIGASTNNILLFREPGNELAEIIATHSSTSPSGNTITLASNLTESHPAGTKIYIIRANQVRFFHSSTEDDANSDDSNLSALAAAQDIDPTTIRNFYNDEAQTSGYYYYRFQDSINSVNLLYSDPIPWGQYNVQFDKNEVGYVIEFARKKLGHEWNERFSKQDAIDEINACFRYIQGQLKHWSNYLVHNYTLGQTQRGSFSFSLPSDIYDNKSNKSILQVRLGTSDDPLLYVDEKEFDQLMQAVAYTTVRTQANAGETTLEITNSYDFDSSGTVNIYTNNTVDAITYTGVTRSTTTGVLTGISASGSGAIGATHSVDTYVWQDEDEGEPKYFTIKDGSLYIWPLPDSTWQNKNLFIDYYNNVTSVDSESDVIDTPRYDMVKHWLLWQGKNYWRNNGNQNLKDGDFSMFSQILEDAIRTEISGQKWKLKPDINQVKYRSTKKQDFSTS